MTDLDDAFVFALELALEAGAIASRFWRNASTGLGLRLKPRGGGPVTRADLEVDAMCVRRIAERFPDDDIVAEESHRPDRSRTARRRWYIDPIDGTRDFARGRPGWAILVGLCVDERPVLGVVHEPVARWTGWARVDGAQALGLQLRGEAPNGIMDARAQPLRSRPRDPDAAILASCRIYPLTRASAIRRALVIPSARTRTNGSVGLRMSMVARGDADVYVQAPGRTSGWDTCAASVLLTTAGATVTDFLGRPLLYGAEAVAHRTGVVVAHADRHGAILGRLAPLAARWLGPSAARED